MGEAMWGLEVFRLFVLMRDLSSPKGGRRKRYPLPTPPLLAPNPPPAKPTSRDIHLFTN